MIKLDKYDTARLLITKLWQHKSVPKKECEPVLDYSKRVFAHQCRVDNKYLTWGDVKMIWVSFAEDTFDTREFKQFLRLVTCDGYDPVRAIIGIIQAMKVKDRFELDESDILKTEQGLR